MYYNVYNSGFSVLEIRIDIKYNILYTFIQNVYDFQLFDIGVPFN